MNMVAHPALRATFSQWEKERFPYAAAFCFPAKFP